MANLLVRGSQDDEFTQLLLKLTEQLGDDAKSFSTLGDVFDANAEAAVRHWQAGVGLVADGVIGPHCQTVLGLRTSGGLASTLTVELVRHLFPATKPASIVRYLPYVTAALEVMGLTDRPMICAALGTIRAESEGFVPISEFQSHFNTRPGGVPFGIYDESKMKKALGNTKPGDGARFKGRGFVQLTGRYNYTRYGSDLNIDLVTTPDLANAPEVAALLLAQFLATHAKAMRKALAEGCFSDARKLVNGGTHGLDRFQDVFKRADKVWPTTVVTAAKAGKRAAAAPPEVPAKKRLLTVRKDPGDLNDRPYLPPPVGLQEVFPSDTDVNQFLPLYTKAGLVLDQGQEGACTGFGLACVVNYLRWSKAGHPARQMDSVSPRMLYTFARRYDEYAGEDYEGSSCRGAIKGWFKHGVCLESDWPYHAADQHDPLQPKYGYAQRASKNTLGVYYRIDQQSITDMQAAIQAVGAVYVSAFTHDGWCKVSSSGALPSGHDALPPIPFDGRPSQTNGHAFALVGFNTRGFVIQNSWGKDFGAGGFAILSYADWLTNGMDAWVVAMGVPGVVSGRVSIYSEGVRGLAGSANTSSWWSEDKAYQHSVVMGNDGWVQRYLTEDELTRTLQHQVTGLPGQWFRTLPPEQPKRLIIFAHGGLNDQTAAIQRARAMGRHFLGNGCYPLFMVWKTGLLESIGNIISDAFRKQPVLAGGAGEWVSEKTDLLLERTIGPPTRPVWSEMKENAELAFNPGRGGYLLIKALQQLVAIWGESLEVHLVGHSAGAILLGHLLTALSARQLVGKVKSIHLYAPACTVQFANQHYAPHTDLMKRLYMQVLSDRVERNDNVATIYRKSLLYFVSNSLETDLRTPILGLENAFKQDYSGWNGDANTSETLKAWRQAAANAGLNNTTDRLTVVDKDKVTVALPEHQSDAAHGCFDNAVTVVSQTLINILGRSLPSPVDDLRGF